MAVRQPRTLNGLSTGLERLLSGLQQDQVGEWPTAEPSLQQHERVCDAVRGYGLPSARLATVADRQAIYDRGLTRAAALAAASPQELETIAVPLDIILP